MKRRELVEVCSERAGSTVRGAAVALRLTQWAYVAQWVGHFPTIAEYAAESYVDPRTAERHRAVIRSVFTEAEFRELVEQLVAADVAHRSPRSARRTPVAVGG